MFERKFENREGERVCVCERGRESVKEKERDINRNRKRETHRESEKEIERIRKKERKVVCSYY